MTTITAVAAPEPDPRRYVSVDGDHGPVPVPVGSAYAHADGRVTRTASPAPRHPEDAPQIAISEFPADYFRPSWPQGLIDHLGL